MAPDRISVGVSPFEPTVVDLWGTTFHTKPVTRSLDKELDERQAEIDIATENGDAAVEAFGKWLDAYIAPTGESKKKPSTLLKERWKAEKATLPEINGLYADLVAVSRARPT